MKILIFDTETTGLSKSKKLTPETIHLWPYIVQFSYIIFDDTTNTIVKIYDKVIKLKPYNVISEGSIKLHGITNEISEMTGINVNEALLEFLRDIEFVDLVVAHNAEFDLSLVKAELIRACIENEKTDNIKQYYENQLNKIVNCKKIYCTMQESIDICKIEKVNSRGTYFKFPSLSELHQKLFQVEPRNLHNSLHDILITLRCFIKIRCDDDVLEYTPAIKNLFINLL
jgi:DNA polymerase III epsilon subunit-like protein